MATATRAELVLEVEAMGGLARVGGGGGDERGEKTRRPSIPNICARWPISIHGGVQTTGVGISGFNSEQVARLEPYIRLRINNRPRRILAAGV